MLRRVVDSTDRSGGDGGQGLGDELVDALVEMVAAQQAPGHDDCAPLTEHAGEAVERLAGMDGIGHERRHLLAVHNGQALDPARPSRAVAKEHQPVDPGADEHHVRLGQLLQADVGDVVNGNLDAAGRDLVRDELSGPGRVAGEALVDDDRSSHVPLAPTVRRVTGRCWHIGLSRDHPRGG
jgi:hypothetical protein